MLITKVELENIKNCKGAEYEFGPGVTAICGPNGVGKTTILEAIAWALFDHLNYTRENFLKRGEKRGSVRVTFVSSEDGREYTVFRDTSGGYYVYDPLTKVKVAEQKIQVIRWLRQHIGVEAGTDLETLFVTTIGVPQGTFTFDFSQSAAKRKPVFDRILKVEEYQRSAELLKALVRLVEDRIAVARERIAGVEGELRRFDEIVDEKESLIARVDGLKAELVIAAEERNQALAELAALDELKARLDKLQSEVDRIEFQIKHTENQKKTVQDELEKARQSAQIVERARPGYEAFLSATEELKRLEPERAARDRLKNQIAAQQQNLIKVEAELININQQIEQIERDCRELETLIPLAQRQEQLEAERGELQKQLGQKQGIEEAIKALDKELDQLRKNFTETSKRIEEVEKLESSAGRAARLEEDRSRLEAELKEKALAQQSQRLKSEQLEQQRAACAKLQSEIDSLDRQIAAAAQKEPLAAQLEELEMERRKLTNTIAQLKAVIERDERMSAEVRNGLCPLLSQRCPLMKEGETLDDYFSAHLTDNRAQLVQLEASQLKLDAQLRQAREAASITASLATLRQQRDKRAQELKLQQQQIAQSEAAMAAAPSISQESIDSLRARIQGIEEELRKAQKDRIEYEKLEPLRTRLSEIKKEGAEKRELRDAQIKRLEALSSAPLRLEEVESSLKALGDPRGRSAQLRKNISNEERLRADLAAKQDEKLKLSAALGKLEEELQVYSGLDERWQDATLRRTANEPHFQAFLANQAQAATVARREEELAEIIDSLSKLYAELKEKGWELNEAKAAYSPQRHSDVRVRVDGANRRIAQLEAQIQTSCARIEDLQKQIDHLNEIQKQLSEHLARKQRYEELLKISEFIRECLKKAGPHITEAYLYTISIEANQLYREITGNSLVNLRWDSDYEILLEEDGRERPFTSLSGGEQMAAALSVRLALLKELSNLRVAFFDEPTTNMDEERRRNLAQQIGRIKDFEQLFVISHDDSFEGHTDRTIQLQPGKGHKG